MNYSQFLCTNSELDSASYHDDRSDDDVVHDMKMEQLEQQNGTNIISCNRIK